MTRYILKRLLYVIIVFLIVSFLMFFLYNLIPGANPAQREWMDRTKQTDFKSLTLEEKQAEKDAIYRRTGYDKPIIIRYLRWLGVYNAPNSDSPSGLLQGDLGIVLSTKSLVSDYIKDPLLNTMFINVFSIFLSLLITIPLGIKCAIKKGKSYDTAVQIATIIGYSLPGFIIAIIFIYLFAILIPIFPIVGINSSTADIAVDGWFSFYMDRLWHIALPTIVMVATGLGGMTRYVRASMIDALSMDCVRTARSKGLREKVVVYSHAWKNALIPVVSLVVGWFLSVFSGSIVIEQSFGLLGLGAVYIRALNDMEYNIVLAMQMFYCLIALLGNLLIDILYGFVDPRIRVNK